MTSPQKRKGDKAERDVLGYLTECGISADRIPAGATLDRGDLWIASPQFPTIDVKDHATPQLGSWVERAAEQAANAGRTAGVVWHKRRGKTNPADWFVTMSGESFVALIKAGGA